LRKKRANLSVGVRIKTLGNKTIVGQYFKTGKNIQQLIGILLISVLLCILFLAAQFESFVQRLSWFLHFLWASGWCIIGPLAAGSSLNVMSAIGSCRDAGNYGSNECDFEIDTDQSLRLVLLY